MHSVHRWEEQSNKAKAILQRMIPTISNSAGLTLTYYAHIFMIRYGNFHNALHKILI